MDFEIPDAMPVFGKYAHASPREGACVMEYISLLTGDKWTDYPKCTDRLVAWYAQSANDCLPDERRTVEMLPRLQRIMRARPLPVYMLDELGPTLDRYYSSNNSSALGYPEFDYDQGDPYLRHLDRVLDHHEKLLHHWSRAQAMHLARTGWATVVRPERTTVDA